MKIGFKSRLWGSRISNIQKVLDLIADSGYQGVEFSQRPEDLGCRDCDELLKLLSERNLMLLSLTCGSLGERLSFLGSYKPSYLSIRHSDIPRIPELIDGGYLPALHPGVFNPVRRTSDVLAVLEEYPDIRFLCDTAHITIAGDDPIEVVNLLKDHMVAVHFKDWTPEFGRSGPRYARGFTELGKGTVKLEQTLTQLQKDKFEGWIVAEVENTYQDETGPLISTTKWFSDRGLLSSKLNKIPDLRINIPTRHHPVSQSHEADAKFREGILVATTKEPEHFYSFLARTIEDLTPCDLLTIWAVSPSQEQMGLLFSSVPIQATPESGLVIRTNKALSGISIERQASITRFDLTKEDPGAEYGFPGRKLEHSDLTQGFLPKQMTSLPIYNSDHRNYVRMIISIFHHNKDLNMTDDQLYWCGQAIAIASDIVLDKMCSVASTRVNLIAGQSKDLVFFLNNLKSLIQRSLRCDGVAIFLVNEAGDKLELQETTGTSWMVEPGERFYKKGEGLTGKAWERNEALLTVNSLFERGHKGKSEEIVDEFKQHACLWVPFVNSKGDVLGIIRCRNKKNNLETITPNMFTDDDASVLDAIGQALVPHLQILLDKERRVRALGRLTHELRVPLVSIRGAAELMQRTKGVEKLFEHDYPGDIWSWSELMRRLLGNADLFRYSPGEIPIQASPTLLLADVVAPAVKQARILLEEREFSIFNINYGTFEKIPKLWVDRNQFQQVIFNLISNAIKHCYADPSSFQVEIDGTKIEGDYVIQVRDWGPGIDNEMKDAIFEEGIRTSEAIQRNITGQGLGLWVVREIVKRHGGSVRVTSLKQPTEISIFLPSRLSKKTPLVS
jgi:signal transduction histidine kinase/sugar phosphate isomerase/epimerase